MFKKLYLFIISSTLLSGYLIFLYFNYQKVTQLESLSKDVSLNNVLYQNQTYQIERGRIKPEVKKGKKFFQAPKQKDILSLVAFFILTKEDPLFFAPGQNGKDLKYSLDHLLDLENQFLALAQKPYPTKLFPDEFFKDIPLIIETSKQFLTQPSDKQALHLLTLYQKVAQDYQKEAQALFNILKTIAQGREETPYVALASATIPQIILEDFEKILENAQLLQIETKKRKDCLLAGKCWRIQFREPEIKPFLSFPPPPLLPTQVLFNYLDFNSYRGPYQVATPCFGFKEDGSIPHHLFYLVFQKNKDNQARTFPKLATQNYYRKLAPYSPKEKALLKKGQPFSWQPESNVYMCNHLEYQVELIALDQFFSDFKEKPIFGNKINDPTPQLKEIWQKGEKIENQFFHSKIPDQETLQILGDFYGFAYQSLTPFSGVLNISSLDLTDLETLKEELLKRHLIIKRKLNSLSLVLNLATDNFEGFVLRNKEKEVPLDYLYFIRSLYSLVYFPFSPSFFKLSSRLTYLESKNPTIDEKTARYLTLDQVLKKYSLEEILSWKGTAN